MKWSTQDSDHDGWLVCDGRNVKRTAYKALFSAISDTFGAGDGSTTFTLPDLRGRVPAMTGTGPGLSNRRMGASTGTETHRLSTGEMPDHSHAGSTSNDGSHTHTSSYYVYDRASAWACVYFSSPSNGECSNGNRIIDFNPLTMNGGAHSHTVTINSAGSGSAHSNMQPTLFVGNFFIYSGVNA